MDEISYEDSYVVGDQRLGPYHLFALLRPLHRFRLHRQAKKPSLRRRHEVHRRPGDGSRAEVMTIYDEAVAKLWTRRPRRVERGGKRPCSDARSATAT